MIPLFHESELRAAVTPAVAVKAVRDAFRADGEGRAFVPAVINLAVPDAHGEFHVKTARIAGVPYVAVKIASGFYDNPAKGLPSGSGLMALFDASTGLPVAVLFDNGYLTDVRTGAAGAVAAEYLAPTSIDVVGVIGTGVQGRQQVACLREVRRFTRLVAWSPIRADLDRYCAEMRESWTLDVRAAVGAEEVCRAADVVVTATPAREPFVRAEWLRPGMHVTAVGADSPGKQELETACLSRATLIVVDRLDQCVAFGELRAAIEAGAVRREDVHGELGAVVAGRLLGRTSEDDLTVTDLTGVGFQDTAIASAAYELLCR